jgi:cytochrome c oxidase cbb3-type subunit I/II
LRISLRARVTDRNPGPGPFRRGALGMLLLAELLLGANASRAAESGHIKTGKLVYERYCISCHGAQGDGQGEAAAHMAIKPRDYRQGTFKWRSTPSGSLPLDADLEHTLMQGLYGTYMPTWRTLDDRSRHDVIAYIKTFSTRFATETPQPPIAVPPDPGYSAASVGRGAAIYQKYNCSQCHGTAGRGDGPSAGDMKDDWGNVSVAYDLTQGHFKCGNQAADIYKVFMTGLSGTPMPAFADSLSSADAWDLVHFIESLGAKK